MSSRLPSMRVILRRMAEDKSHLTPHYFKFERTMLPPMQKPKESPYIVGPYLKPDYMQTEYITEPIKHREIDDLEHYVYKPTKVFFDQERTVQLLLIEDVEGWGIAGQVIDVPFRLGASKLVAMRKAEYATDFAAKWYKFGPRTAQSASSALSPRTVRMLQKTTFKLPVSPNVEVQPWHISLSLRLAGCICPLDAIENDSIVEYTGDNDEKRVKCVVIINNHEKTEVSFIYADPQELTK